MKFIELEQGSQKWLAWRKEHVTASDAASILGISPYTSAYKCWQRKLGLIPEQPKSPAMQRGIDDEPVAREIFNNRYNLEMKPAVIESLVNPCIGASMDGICGGAFSGYIGLEVKSQNIHAIRDSGIPPYHFSQLQHQFLASDGLMDMIYYVTYWNGEIDVIEVKPDQAWLDDYLTKALDFWKKIIWSEAPELTAKDYVDMSQNQKWHELAEQYRTACQQIKALEEMKDFYRKHLIDLSSKNSCVGAGLKLLYKESRGRIDYDSIPQLVGINLDAYRKPKSTSVVIMLDK